MLSARQLHSSVAICRTEIMVIGGYDNTNSNGDLATCEIIDVTNGTIRPGPSMNFPRSYFATLVTKDTNIIVISGCTRGFDSLTTAVEIFDKSTRSWRILGNLKIARWQHCAEFLNDHEILIIGGRHGNTEVMPDVEIFDINTGQSRLVNPFPFPTSDAVCGTTSNGKIISLGGREGGTNSNRSKYIFEYDLINDNWSIIDSVKDTINMPTMIKLIDSRLIIIGGIYKDDPAIVSDEVFIENNGRFNVSGKVLNGRFRFPMVQFNSDSVLVIGGYYNYNTCTNKCEWYNINSNFSTPAPDLNYARYNFTAVSVPDPNNTVKNVVFAIGGNNNQNQSLSSVEILRDSIVYTSPQIIESSSDCENYYFTVSDINLIDRVQLTGFNQNVRISTIETLPTSLVHVIVSLIDPNKNGYFEFTCYCNKKGLATVIKDTIVNKISNLNITEPIKNGKIDLGYTLPNKVKCADIVIVNNGTIEVIIDSASLYFNREFYIPSGQLPITIPIGQQRTLRLCFLPTNTGNFNDTLYLKDNCDSLMFNIEGVCTIFEPPVITDTSSDCYNYYFTVSDTNLINRVQLTGFNQNVRISIIETLPAIVVHVVVSLIDPKLSGYFEFTCYCNKTGLSVNVKDTIFKSLKNLYAHFPVPGAVIFVIDTIVGSNKCVNLLLDNNGTETIVIDTASLIFNSEFSVPGNQLPIIIPPNQQKQLTICFKSDLEGQFSDTLYLINLCDTIVKTIHGHAYGNKPSEVKETSSDCEHYYITVIDSNFINRVDLSGSNNRNVKITVIESLPSRIVHVIISLIDPNQNGYFTVTFYCTASNKSVDVSGTIYSKPSSLLVLAPLDNGVISVGNTEFGNLHCIKVLLQNTGNSELVVDYVLLFRNIEFSIPQYQLPIIIPAQERKELELCYLPSALGEQYDTLLLNDLCDTLVIPVKAECDTAYYGGISRCSVYVKGKTQGTWKKILIGNPYPNPGNTVATIDIFTEIDFEEDFNCSLLDNIGNSISCPVNTFSKNISLEGNQLQNRKFIFGIGELASGTYFIQIISGNIKRVVPYFILR